MMESALSPPMVLSIALSEKCFPLDAIFILLMMYALMKEPAMNAMKLAAAILGASPKIAWNPASLFQ